jgi:hypothetical protein
MPGRRLASVLVTSGVRGQRRQPHNAAAESWLSSAPSPQATDGRHRDRDRFDPAVANRVHAGVDTNQSPRPAPASDQHVVRPERAQLPPRDVTVLTTRGGRDF